MKVNFKNYLDDEQKRVGKEEKVDSQKKMLPIGYDDFADVRRNNRYYVDKTGLIRELMKNGAKVTLFTRPRRFGKSLNMSMLANFFSVTGDKSIFDGLEISKDTELCEKYMGKYPVIFLTLKKIDADNYETAFGRAVQLINAVANKFEFLEQSDKLSAYDKTEYRILKDSAMSESTFMNSLLTLSRLLEKHYGRKVVLLVDEYDVPLAKANENGYYDRMITLIRGFLGDALKTNESLEFAVLTGCLRVSKESIFTGLNNLRLLSVSSDRCDEYFGFTEAEVKMMLEYYDLSDHYEELKDWYDGYRFGSVDVFCPWDVLNQCDELLANPRKRPLNHWINSSSNYAVRKFVEMADGVTKKELEALVAGETIVKEIREDLTYSEIYKNINNLWSLLYTTGYLTKRGEVGEDEEGENSRIMRLGIPNKEVRDVYVMQIFDLFDEGVREDNQTLRNFCDALTSGDAETVGDLFTEYLERTISIRDSGQRAQRRESFYHGILLGILSANGKMDLVSNREAGDGYADILVKSEDGRTGIVIEMKYAADGDLDKACESALEQIEKIRYADAFKYTRVKTVRKYGFACYRKFCQVVSPDA